jgi:hypothetical protein
VLPLPPSPYRVFYGYVHNFLFIRRLPQDGCARSSLTPTSDTPYPFSLFARAVIQAHGVLYRRYRSVVLHHSFDGRLSARPQYFSTVRILTAERSVYCCGSAVSMSNFSTFSISSS